MWIYVCTHECWRGLSFITVGGIHLIWLFDLGLFMSIIASKIMSLSLLSLVCKTHKAPIKSIQKKKEKSNLLWLCKLEYLPEGNFSSIFSKALKNILFVPPTVTSPRSYPTELINNGYQILQDISLQCYLLKTDPKNLT